MKDRDVEIKGEGVIELMWEAWYDGYVYAVPMKRDVNIEAVEAAHRKSETTDKWKCTHCEASGTGQGWMVHRRETGHYTITARI